MSISHDNFLQLLELVDSNSQLKLHMHNLEKVIDPVKEKTLSIISVVGTSPQNKNFLIGFLIKYLKSLQRNIETLTGSMDGFLWKDGYIPDPDIGGTWLFRSPFILQNKFGADIAVIILYTQLPAEQLSTSDNCMNEIVGLNILISSIVILDSFRHLPQKLLKSLDESIKYALLRLEDTSSKFAFRSLKFLIRDWKFPAEYPFGEQGGQKFLQKILSETKDSMAVKEKLAKHFEQLSCHLVPFPGCKAISPQFRGLIEDLDTVYIETVNQFVSSFIQTNNLLTSKIYAQSVRSVKPVIESYIKAINSGLAPKPSEKSKTPTTSPSMSEVNLVEKQLSQTLTQPEPVGNPKLEENSITTKVEFVTTDAHAITKSIRAVCNPDSLLNKCFAKYKELFDLSITNVSAEYYPDSRCKLAHSSAVKASRDLLKRKVQETNEGKTTLKVIEKSLKEKIEKEFEEFKNGNNNKKQEFVKNAIFECKQKYQTAMKAAFSGFSDEIDNNKVDDKSAQVIESLIADFKTQLQLLGDDEPSHPVAEQLERDLKNEAEIFLKHLQEQKVESIQFSKSAFEQALSEYKRGMSSILSDIQTTQNTKNWDVCHTEIRERCFRMLKLKIGGGNNPLLKQLGTEIENAYQMLQEQQKLQEDFEAASNALQDDLLAAYSKELELQNDSEPKSTEERSQLHATRVKEILDEFKTKLDSQSVPKQSIYGEQLRQKLYKLFSQNLKTQANLKKERETTIQKAFESALNFYRNEMTKQLNIKYYLNDKEFDTCNENITTQSCNTYLTFLQEHKIPLSVAPSEDRLKLKLVGNIREFKAENNQNRHLAASETKNLVHACIKVYLANMTKGMVLVWNQDTLQNLHKESMKIAIIKLEEDCVKKEDPQFLKPFMEGMKKEMETEFEEIEELFEMKSNAETDSINIALAKARQEYNNEMDKHFKNHEFIQPKVLEGLHKELNVRVIKSCFEINAMLKEAHKLQLQEGLNLIFEKYKQQNDMNLQVEPAIGIDLGTTYSCVAVYAKGKVHIIRNHNGKNTTPSYVSFNQDGKETVGDPAKNRAYENPENTIFDTKRIIGRRFNDPKLQDDMKLWPFNVVDDFGVPKILVGGKKLHPEEIAAKILSELKRDAKKFLQKEVTKAVITVPAYFTDGQKQATKDAGKMAGLEVLTVQTEPTAAAIAYKLQHSEGKERNVLIFDLGGGTFDVAILKMKKGNIEVLAVDGDTHLGGEDFDKNMMEYCAQEFKKKHTIDLFNGKDSTLKQTKDQVRRRLKRLQGECERKKIDLASAPRVIVTVDRMYENRDLSVIITRETFDQLNDDLFRKTIEVVDTALVAAKVDKSKIDDIVLVGGSTRIPKVQELLKEHFDGKALDQYINPDEAVAYGAAMTAAYMNGTIAKNSIDYNKIQDVTPMSIGVEVYGGSFSVIIPKSTKVPVKLMERYKTAHNNQTSVQITIYQGEDPIAVQNQHLGDFYLNGVPPKQAGEVNIDVEMVINKQGILHVSAVSSSAGQLGVSVVENKFRMGHGAIQRYLEEVPK